MDPLRTLGAFSLCTALSLSGTLGCGDDGSAGTDAGDAGGDASRDAMQGMDTGMDAAADAETDSSTDAGTDAGDAARDARVDAAPPTDAGMDAGSDAMVDAAADSSVDAGTDSGVDAGTDTGVDAADAAPDAPTGPCPAGMAHVVNRPISTRDPFCIDSYEASMGAGGAAQSVAGVMPWANVTASEASAACRNAGKRLCDGAEWLDACQGLARNNYPYGDTYVALACNGFDQGVRGAVNTGSLPMCEGGYPGIFDMSGNVWEWTAPCSFGNCYIRGGSYIQFDFRVDCGERVREPSSTSGAYLGFRCCADPT